MTTTLMLETAGAEIAYDVRGPLPTADGRPPLFMIGQPMDASGYRLGTRLHDRRRARRHRPLRLAAQALRLHRPLPARLPVGRVRSTRPARQTGAEVPAVGARRGRRPCQHPPRLPRALPTDEDAARQTARRQDRASRPRPPTRRGDLAHAHPQPSLRSGRRHRPPGRLTVPKEMRYRSELPSALSSPTRRR
jgi:hypothetical protein